MKTHDHDLIHYILANLYPSKTLRKTLAREFGVGIRTIDKIIQRAGKCGRRGTEERPDPTRRAVMTRCWEAV